MNKSLGRSLRTRTAVLYLLHGAQIRVAPKLGLFDVPVIAVNFPPDELINLDNLLIQLRDITPMWFDLGDALDLPPSILDDIRGQFETNPEQCMIEMVDAWLQRHLSRGSPTWTEVAEALRKINQNSLADALESVYYTGRPAYICMTVRQ